MRNVILHHHIFKNAGSSVDFLLERNFLTKWGTVEGDYPWSSLSNESTIQFIKENKDLVAVSSHQARIFRDSPSDINICPIIFLREPIDRARSCYEYEYRINQKYPSSVAAQRGADYYFDFNLDESNPNRIFAFANFQTLYLSSASDCSDLRNRPVYEKHLSEAQDYLMKQSYFGLVEDFHDSILNLQKILSRIFNNIVFDNVVVNFDPSRRENINLRVKQLKQSIGHSLYERLIYANQFDIRLYQFAASRHKDLMVNFE